MEEVRQGHPDRYTQGWKKACSGLHYRHTGAIEGQIEAIEGQPDGMPYTARKTPFNLAGCSAVVISSPSVVISAPSLFDHRQFCLMFAHYCTWLMRQVTDEMYTASGTS